MKFAKSYAQRGTHAQIVTAALGVGAPRGAKEDPRSMRRLGMVSIATPPSATVAMVTRWMVEGLWSFRSLIPILWRGEKESDSERCKVLG